MKEFVKDYNECMLRDIINQRLFTTLPADIPLYCFKVSCDIDSDNVCINISSRSNNTNMEIKIASIFDSAGYFCNNDVKVIKIEGIEEEIMFMTKHSDLIKNECLMSYNTFKKNGGLIPYDIMIKLLKCDNDALKIIFENDSYEPLNEAMNSLTCNEFMNKVHKYIELCDKFSASVGHAVKPETGRTYIIISTDNVFYEGCIKVIDNTGYSFYLVISKKCKISKVRSLKQSCFHCSEFNCDTCEESN